MRILRKDIKHGNISMMPEVLDDFWVLYNIIEKGDKVYARTTREVRAGDRYDRAEKGKRISVLLGVSVEKTMWDRNLNRLRVHGTIGDAPEEIGAEGAHHTLSIDLNTSLTISKTRWMDYQLNQLERSTGKRTPPVVVISIDDEGYCIAILRGYGVDVKIEERINLPGKLMAEERTKTLQHSFKTASKNLIEVSASLQNPIIVIIGLGFIKNDFTLYLEENSPDIRSKVIDVKSVNSSGKAGIYEALRSSVLGKALRHARVSEEAQSVEEVLKRLGKASTNVAYGLTEVEKANTFGAIEEVLLTDIRLREASDEDRKKLEELMRGVEGKKGRIAIVSVEHEAGMKLESLGGVAALLRFPVS